MGGDGTPFSPRVFFQEPQCLGSTTRDLPPASNTSRVGERLGKKMGIGSYSHRAHEVPCVMVRLDVPHADRLACSTPIYPA
jgi:hypothetical protein